MSLLRRFIISPLTLFEVQHKVLLHPIELRQPSFGKTLEGLDPINVNASGNKMFAFIDP